MHHFYGHGTRTAWTNWNVSFWLSRDAATKKAVSEWLEQGLSVTKMTNLLHSELAGSRTPEGALYTKAAIKQGVLACIS